MFVNQAGGLRGQRRDVLGLDDHKKNSFGAIKAGENVVQHLDLLR